MIDTFIYYFNKYQTFFIIFISIVVLLSIIYIITSRPKRVNNSKKKSTKDNNLMKESKIDIDKDDEDNFFFFEDNPSEGITKTDNNKINHESSEDSKLVNEENKSKIAVEKNNDFNSDSESSFFQIQDKVEKINNEIDSHSDKNITLRDKDNESGSSNINKDNPEIKDNNLSSNEDNFFFQSANIEKTENIDIIHQNDDEPISNIKETKSAFLENNKHNLEINEVDYKPIEKTHGINKSIPIQNTVDNIKQTTKGSNEKLKPEETHNNKKAVKKTVKTPKKTLGRYHVLYRKTDKKWYIKREGSEKTVKVLETQREAIAFATIKAINQETSIVVHKRDGKIRKGSF